MTIWLFYRLTDETTGRLPAIAGVALLATDPVFLLSTCFDWGPVALQLVMGCGALLALIRFQRGGGMKWAATAGALIGLALWNKALFLWALTGAIVAAAVTFKSSSSRLFRGPGPAYFLAGL